MSVLMLVVGKCRFWRISIFRIGFSFDDVTSNRTGPESASVATTYGVADSGPVLFLESDFGAMTSRRLVAVATTYGVADSGAFLFLESDFGAMTSRRLVAVATIIGVRDGRRHLRFWRILVHHWCPRCLTVIY